MHPWLWKRAGIVSLLSGEYCITLLPLPAKTVACIKRLVNLSGEKLADFLGPPISFSLSLVNNFFPFTMTLDTGMLGSRRQYKPNHMHVHESLVFSRWSRGEKAWYRKPSTVPSTSLKKNQTSTSSPTKISWFSFEGLACFCPAIKFTCSKKVRTPGRSTTVLVVCHMKFLGPACSL